VGGNAYKFNSYHLRRARQKAAHLRNEIGRGIPPTAPVLSGWASPRCVTEKVSKGRSGMSLEIVERQLASIAAQVATAMAMVAVESGGAQAAAAAALSVVKRAPMDPIREVQMLAAKYVAEGNLGPVPGPYRRHADAGGDPAACDSAAAGPGRRDPAAFGRSSWMPCDAREARVA